MIEGVLLPEIVLFIARNEVTQRFCKVNGLGMIWSAARNSIVHAQNKASSDFAYLLFCGDGGTIDCKAVRVAGQGVQVVEVVAIWSLQARWSCVELASVVRLRGKVFGPWE